MNTIDDLSALANFDHLTTRVANLANGKNSVKDIAIRLGLDPKTISREFSKLQNWGFVRLVTDPLPPEMRYSMYKLDDNVNEFFNFLKMYPVDLPISKHNSARHLQDKEIQKIIKDTTKKGNEFPKVFAPEMDNSMSISSNLMLSKISDPKYVKNRHSGDALDYFQKQDLNYIILPEPAIRNPFKDFKDNLRKFYPIIGTGLSSLFKIEIDYESKPETNKIYYVEGALVERYIVAELVEEFNWKPYGVKSPDELIKITKEEIDKENSLRILIKPPHHITISRLIKDITKKELKIVKMLYNDSEIRDYVGFDIDFVKENPQIVGNLVNENHNRNYKMLLDTPQSNNFKQTLVLRDLKSIVERMTFANMRENVLKKSYEYFMERLQNTIV